MANRRTLIGILALLLAEPLHGQTLPAFPGAQGGGAGASCFRGGTIMEVTNLNDSGTGSLRACLTANTPRYCIFRISGLISQLSPNQISNPCVYIAGQTAPGGGIVLGGVSQSGQGLYITTNDVVVRYITDDGNSPLATGPDTGTVGFEPGSSGQNVILDHTSCRWAGNKCFITYTSNTDTGSIIKKVSYQWSMLYEPNWQHPVGPMTDTAAYQGQSGPQDLHHNLYVNIGHRIPLMNTSPNTFESNIVYNWCDPVPQYGWATEPQGSASDDIINNLYVPGNMNSGCSNAHPVNVNPIHSSDCTSNCLPDGNPSIYLSGNSCAQGTDWQCSAEVTSEGGGETATPVRAAWQRSSPLPAEPFPITADPANSLGALLTPTVGNSQHLTCTGTWVSNRDSQDLRIVTEYQTLSPGGLFAANLPPPAGENGPYFGPPSGPAVVPGTPCPEDPANHLPTAYEQANNIAPGTPSNTVMSDGYTLFEHYLSGTGATPPPPTGATGWLGADALTGTLAIGQIVIVNSNAGPVRASGCTAAGGAAGAPISPQPSPVVGASVTIVAGPSPVCSAGVAFWQVQFGGTPPPPATGVTVTCTPSTIASTATSACAAVVVPSGASHAVTWTATGGTVKSGGVFTPASGATSGVVTATSVSTPAVGGNATVTITATPPPNTCLLYTSPSPRDA